MAPRRHAVSQLMLYSAQLRVKGRRRDDKERVVCCDMQWLKQAPQLDQIQKNRQKEIQKIREIVGSYLCLQRFDKF